MSDVLALLERLAAAAARDPGAPAIVAPGGRGAVTRAALVARARHVARGLQEAGLRPGDRVLFAVRPGAAAVALIVGVLEAGGVVVAADLAGGDALFAARMALVAPRWVIAESALLWAAGLPLVRRLARLPSLDALGDATMLRAGPPLPGAWRARGVGSIERAGRRAERGRAAPPAPAPDPEAPAFVVFTSGTTGAPRAVVHSRRSLAATLRVVDGQLAMAEGDVLYARELHLILPALFAGATAVVPGGRGFSPRRALRDLARHRVTHAFAVTADAQRLVDFLVRQGARLPDTLRQLLLGAAPVRAAFLRRLQEAMPAGADAWCVYGMTEMLPVATVTLAEKLAYDGAGDLLGAPVPGVRARVSSAGELVVAGAQLCTGYLGEPPMREHATGDLARVDGDRLVLLGRRKDMIIRGRHNIYPALHEPVVERIDGVRRCAMVGVWREAAADERVVLVVEPSVAGGDDAALAARVTRLLRAGPTRIDDEAQPDLVLVAPLPESGRSRKVDRQALCALAARALAERDGECASR